LQVFDQPRTTSSKGSLDVAKHGLLGLLIEMDEASRRQRREPLSIRRCSSRRVPPTIAL
jgi:hypothetical protein